MPKKWEVKQKDFRSSYPKVVRSQKGWVWISENEELVGGHWEGFVSYRSGWYKTKAEALKNKPRVRR